MLQLLSGEPGGAQLQQPEQYRRDPLAIGRRWRSELGLACLAAH